MHRDRISQSLSPIPTQMRGRGLNYSIGAYRCSTTKLVNRQSKLNLSSVAPSLSPRGELQRLNSLAAAVSRDETVAIRLCCPGEEDKCPNFVSLINLPWPRISELLRDQVSHRFGIGQHYKHNNNGLCMWSYLPTTLNTIAAALAINK